MDDFTKLLETQHMLKWFSDEPFVAIRAEVERGLKEQVADSRLTSFNVTSDPQWLTGARRSSENDDTAIIVRAAVAFEFVLTVESQGKVYQLSGVYTWAAVRLDQPGKHKHRIWIDLDGTLATFGSNGELKSRVYFE